MWNDKETSVDFIGHSIIADSIKELVYDDDLSPLTIGVFGDWGVGKSSVLKMVEETFNGDKETLCLTFNGWLFQGYDDAKSALMEVIIRELSAKRGSKKSAKLVAKNLLKQVDWFRLSRRAAGMAATAGLFGVPIDVDGLIERILGGIQEKLSGKKEIEQEDIESALDAAKDLVKSGNGVETTAVTAVHEFRESFNKLLTECKVKRLVILVDDLDRCLPNTAIEVLEAIRLFLFVPRTTFIIAADENMIAYAVRKHFPDLPITGKALDYSRSYLEKLIQVPFRIPNLNFREVQNYIALLLLQNDMKTKPARFQSLHEQRMLALRKPWDLSVLDEKEAEKLLGDHLGAIESTSIRLSYGVAMQLTEGLSGNPRQIKRFLNTLMLRYRVAKVLKVESTFNLQVLVKLMMLERFRETIYVELMEIAIRNAGGKCEVLQTIEKSSKEGTKPDIKNVDGNQQAAKWIEDETWFMNWARLEPSLGDIDIRPYAYISKDKSLGLSLENELGDELGQIASGLLSGSVLKESDALKKIVTLNGHDAKRLFESLVTKASTVNWGIAAKPILAFMRVAKCHVSLQLKVLDIFESHPSQEMGAWVMPNIDECITDSTQLQRKVELYQRWAQDDSLLGRAAKQSLSKGVK
ncbi:MAG: p-loop protein [Firmicutes bacterium]|nr:p-loop protein [Bacillota bacterium]